VIWERRRGGGRAGVWAGRLRGLSDLPYCHRCVAADSRHGRYYVFDDDGACWEMMFLLRWSSTWSCLSVGVYYIRSNYLDE